MSFAYPPSLSFLGLALALSACTTTPHEPSVLVLPGPGKGFEQFRADNDTCKQFAREQTGGRTPEGVAIDSGVRSAVVGTILGAAAGAAMDGSSGASEGAAGGLALGGLVGAGTGETSASRLQRRYDFGYQQCMYAKGHRIPAAGGDLMSDFFHGSRGGYREPLPPPAPLQQ